MAKLAWLEPLGVLTCAVTLLMAGGAAYVAYRDRFPDEPPEQRRWKSLQPMIHEGRYDADVAMNEALHPELPTVSVYSSPSRKAASPTMTLKDLSDRGQAQLIASIAASGAGEKGSRAAGEPTAPWQLVADALNASRSSPEHKDPYRADRVLIATIAKPLDALPGDRLSWARVLIEPINFRFAGFTVAATETETFKVAAIEDETSEEIALDAGLESLAAKPAISHGLKNTRKATAELSEQVERLGIDIRPESLRIVRESGVGGDVMGNTRVELSAITDPTLIWKGAKTDQPADAGSLVLVVTDAHLVEGGKYLEPPNASLTVLPQTRLPHCSLRAKVQLLYEARKMKYGDNQSYAEGNQSVTTVRGAQDLDEVEIVPADDISPAVWRISRKNSETEGALQAQTNENTDHDLLFTDSTTASEVVHWLKARKAEGAKRVELGELRFNFKAGDTLTPVKSIRDECRSDGQEVAQRD